MSKMGHTGLKSKCQQCCVSSGESRGEPISLRFPASRDCLPQDISFQRMNPNK